MLDSISPVILTFNVAPNIGMSAVAHRFSWDAVAEQMERVYCEAVETHNQGKNNNIAAEAPHES